MSLAWLGRRRPIPPSDHQMYGLMTGLWVSGGWACDQFLVVQGMCPGPLFWAKKKRVLKKWGGCLSDFQIFHVVFCWKSG